MCCFSAKTVVHDTSIFARLVRPGVQALVYQMRYASETPTAMILPLPVALPATEGSVRFVDLEGYPDFFRDLGEGFPVPLVATRSKSAPPPQSPLLAVQKVGAFIATFVPTQGDFERVDPRFALPREVWSRIPGYADYGFAVFQLEELSGTPHPIALEMETRTPDALFFPTVHVHDGTVHERERFHHALYAQDVQLDRRTDDAYAGPGAVNDDTGMARSFEQASAFVETSRALGLVDAGLLVHRATLEGELPNRDTIIPVGGALPRDGATPGGCGRCSVEDGTTSAHGGVALGAALGGLAWVIRRRDARARRGG